MMKRQHGPIAHWFPSSSANISTISTILSISTISTISSLLCHLVPGELPVVGVEVGVELHVLSTLVVAAVVAQPDVVALQI